MAPAEKYNCLLLCSYKRKDRSRAKPRNHGAYRNDLPLGELADSCACNNVQLSLDVYMQLQVLIRHISSTPQLLPEFKRALARKNKSTIQCISRNTRIGSDRGYPQSTIKYCTENTCTHSSGTITEIFPTSTHIFATLICI